MSIKKIVPLYGMTQGNEAFKLIFSDGKEQVIKSWDYSTIYSFPYLYRKLYVDLLSYKCFEALGSLLFKHTREKIKVLRVLDVACGSGLMGKFLKENSPIKVETLVGVDIIPEAITALKRDYPNIYDNAFLVKNDVDLKSISNLSFNCLVISGGASHIELEEIKKYIECINKNGYVVFNLLIEDQSGRRGEILKWLNENLSFCESEIYNHRKLVNGNIVKHEAFLYQKKERYASNNV
jgi:SAM-dependent methyltransferase